MYSPLHATAGLLLAQLAPNPAVAFLMGVGSHYILDAVPHGDTGLGSWMTGGSGRRRIMMVETIDLGTATIVVLALLAQHPQQTWLTLAAGAIGGVTPDLLWGFRFILDGLGWHIPFLTPFLHAHDRIHRWGHARRSYDMPFVIGLMTQMTLLAIVLLLQL